MNRDDDIRVQWLGSIRKSDLVEKIINLPDSLIYAKWKMIDSAIETVIAEEKKRCETGQKQR